MNVTEWLGEAVEQEFEGVDLGDPRRGRRLRQIAARLGEQPDASFPQLFGSSAELEGFYRFLRNESVEWTEVLKPHAEATCRRAEQLGECLVIHDTTDFAFRGQRDGLGPTSSKARGFMAHVSLVVALDEARTPLGVCALQQYARGERKGRRRISARLDDSTSEGRRWLRGAEAVEKLRNGRFECIHVADREGDAFPFLSGMLDFGGRFVVRVSQDRHILDGEDEKLRLHEIVFGLEPKASFDISLSARGKRLNPTQARSHPSRRSRQARVSVAATRVCVAAPKSRRKTEDIELNLVRVWETNPPPGEPAVDWILWTTEPIDSIADIRRVVDIYRARWIIEEYFKALKTGCRFEERQLESFDTLSTALALFAPVAWKLLLARSVVRARPKCPPTEILSPLQVKYLEKRYGQPLITARDALYAMARLGGHLTQNGEPGWQTLGRGFEKLAIGEAFYLALARPKTCDQS
jgi:hypothetical protein